MRLARWACYTTSCLLLFLGGCARTEPPRVVRSAEYAVQWFDESVHPSAPAQLPEGLVWRAVTLPYIAERESEFAKPGVRGIARTWLRFKDERAADAGARALAYSAYLPSGPTASLYVDGMRIAGTDPTLSNAWHRPVLFALPYGPDVARSSHVLALSFDCWVGVLGCGVPQLRIGSQGAISDYYEWQSFLRIDGPRIGSIAIFIVGIFALLFWMRRRHEVVYALFFCASLLWVLRTLHYHLSRYPEPQDWFWWVTINSLTWLSVVVYLFAFRLHNERRPRVEWVLIGAAGLATLSAIPFLHFDWWIFEQIQYGLQTLLSLVVTILLTVAAIRRRSRENVVMAVALWIDLALGVHDALLQNWTLGMQDIFLLPYAALPLFGAFVYAMARRYRGAIDDVERLNASLEERLAIRQRELDASYAQLRRVEIESARNQERQRLMRDMHDGLGSSLMSSLALAERGEADQEFVLGTLRDAVDELKITIDSLEPIESDLATLLATLRYRLGPRLEKAGITVEWEMPDLPTLPWMDAAAALQILRIVQESIANVLKHARATRLRVAAAFDADVCVTIADDGVGFDAGSIPPRAGRGLRNLAQRAAQLGAAIDVSSGAGGTVVSLRLPLERRRKPR